MKKWQKKSLGNDQRSVENKRIQEMSEQTGTKKQEFADWWNTEIYRLHMLGNPKNNIESLKDLLYVQEQLELLFERVAKEKSEE